MIVGYNKPKIPYDETVIDDMINKHKKYIIENGAQLSIYRYTSHSFDIRNDSRIRTINKLIRRAPTSKQPIILYSMVNPNFHVHTIDGLSKTYQDLVMGEMFYPFDRRSYNNGACIISATYDTSVSLGEFNDELKKTFNDEFIHDKLTGIIYETPIRSLYNRYELKNIKHILRQTLSKIGLDIDQLSDIDSLSDLFFMTDDPFEHTEVQNKLLNDIIDVIGPEHFLTDICCGYLLEIIDVYDNILFIEPFSKYQYQHEVLVACGPKFIVTDKYKFQYSYSLEDTNKTYTETDVLRYTFQNPTLPSQIRNLHVIQVRMIS